MRIGVGHPGVKDLVKHFVLHDFDAEEKPEVEKEPQPEKQPMSAQKKFAIIGGAAAALFVLAALSPSALLGHLTVFGHCADCPSKED